MQAGTAPWTPRQPPPSAAGRTPRADTADTLGIPHYAVCGLAEDGGAGRNAHAWLENPAAPEAELEAEGLLGCATLSPSPLGLGLVTATGLPAPE